MSDKSTSNKKARFWNLYRAHYFFARIGRLGRWRSFLTAIQKAWEDWGGPF